jgi:hypothetical protein
MLRRRSCECICLCMCACMCICSKLWFAQKVQSRRRYSLEAPVYVYACVCKMADTTSGGSSGTVENMTVCQRPFAGHCYMSSCDKWILEKDNHFYFINRESARHVMSISCSCYPNVQWIKQEEAREAALFKAFISGTHQRLGEASALLKYLSTCVVPLYEVFIGGCIREASFHLQ